MASNKVSKDGRLGASTRRVQRQRLAREGRRCHICGGEINYAAKFPAPDSFVLDHLQAVSEGGSRTDPANWGAAHAVCNDRRQTTPVDEYRADLERQRAELDARLNPLATGEPATAATPPEPTPGKQHSFKSTMRKWWKDDADERFEAKHGRNREGWL